MSNLLQPANLEGLVESGVVLAANVEFFHSLGLNMDIVKRDGKNTIVITSTDDEEGVLYSEAIPAKVNRLIKDRQQTFEQLKQQKHDSRKKAVGFVKQEV